MRKCRFLKEEQPEAEHAFQCMSDRYQRNKTRSQIHMFQTRSYTRTHTHPHTTIHVPSVWWLSCRRRHPAPIPSPFQRQPKTDRCVARLNAPATPRHATAVPAGSGVVIKRCDICHAARPQPTASCAVRPRCARAHPGTVPHWPGILAARRHARTHASASCSPQRRPGDTARRSAAVG